MCLPSFLSLYTIIQVKSTFMKEMVWLRCILVIYVDLINFSMLGLRMGHRTEMQTKAPWEDEGLSRESSLHGEHAEFGLGLKPQNSIVSSQGFILCQGWICVYSLTTDGA